MKRIPGYIGCSLIAVLSLIVDVGIALCIAVPLGLIQLPWYVPPLIVLVASIILSLSFFGFLGDE